MDLLPSIIHFDQQLFLFFNSSCSNQLLDTVLPLCREKTFWVPLYLFLLGLIWRNFERKTAIVWILGILFTVTLADTWSSRVMKPTFQRLRPCRTETLQSHLHTRVPCGSGYSFTSSHATNHFAVAMFLSLFLGGNLPRLRHILFAWAAIVAFSQVYVGVHFPLDVIFGAFFGLFIGWGVYSICLRACPPTALLAYDEA